MRRERARAYRWLAVNWDRSQGQSRLGHCFGGPILTQQSICEHDMRPEVAGRQFHDSLQQFGFLGEVSLLPLGIRPVEVTVWIARSEPGC